MTIQDEKKMLRDLENDLKEILKPEGGDLAGGAAEENGGRPKMFWVIIAVALLACLALGAWLGPKILKGDSEEEETEVLGITTINEKGEVVPQDCIMLTLPAKGNTQITQLAEMRRFSNGDSICFFIDGEKHVINSLDSTKSYKTVSSVWGSNATTDIVSLKALLRYDNDTETIVDSIMVEKADQSLLQEIVAKAERQDLVVAKIKLTSNDVELPIEIPNVTGYENEATRSLRHADYYFWVVDQVIKQVGKNNEKPDAKQIDVNKIRF